MIRCLSHRAATIVLFLHLQVKWNDKVVFASLNVWSVLNSVSFFDAAKINDNWLLSTSVSLNFFNRANSQTIIFWNKIWNVVQWAMKERDLLLRCFLARHFHMIAGLLCDLLYKIRNRAAFHSRTHDRNHWILDKLKRIRFSYLQFLEFRTSTTSMRNSFSPISCS